MTIFFEEQTFQHVNYTRQPFETGEYEKCIFLNCDLSDADIAGTKFIDCDFQGCNLSMASIAHTIFNNIKFIDCKMLALQFQNCNNLLFAATFRKCIINHSSFYKVNAKNTLFAETSLQEVDFSEANLHKSVFSYCDLARATFAHTNLEYADFTTSYNYSINPETNRIHKAKFSMPEVLGLLSHYDIQIV